jgi:peroxiredoxin
MDAALLCARLVLAAVFAVAGTAKLMDRTGREPLIDFGLPPRLAAPIGWALPVAELLVAISLVPQASAWWGGLGALGLLLAFSAVIARSLVRGERPDCRCFGQLHAAPVGWSTLLRNGVLSAFAAFVLGAGWSDPGPSAVGWVAVLPPNERPATVLGLLAVVLLAAVMAILVRVLVNQAQLLASLKAIEARLDEGAQVERPEAVPPDPGLPVGAPAPAFALPDLDGETRSLGSLVAPGRPVLLIFVSLDCHPCAALAPKIAGWQREHSDAVTMTLVSSGRADENRAKFGGLAGVVVLLQAANEVADAYAAQWTPAAVLIGPTGRLASSVSYGDLAIGALVAHAAASPSVPFLPSASGPAPARPGSLPLVGNGPARPGQMAPPVALPDLEGRTVDLRDYRGRDTLVVFWDPNCPHCQQLSEDLRRWEAEPPRGAPRLFVVSSGSVEANRALGFRSSVVLDESFKVAEAFGARGTPTAVLVNAEGRIVSTVGIGSRDILALAGVVPTVGSPGTRATGA